MKKIKSILKRLKTNVKYTAKKASNWTSYIVALVQLLFFLIEFNDIFPEDWSFLKRAVISLGVVAAIWLVMYAIISIVVLRQKCVEVIDAGNSHHVYVEYGDLLANSEEKRNIVIAFNRCFDTLVDEDLIASSTLHGKFINEICQNGLTAKELNRKIQNNLQITQRLKWERKLTEEEKRKGNLKRYPVGTIAEFKRNEKENYFFLGMSAFNKDLHPETTNEEYAASIQALIRYCNKRSQKLPIYMPVIGAYGLSNKKDERELLEYIVSVLRFNKELINSDIHIIVYSGQRDDISIYGL